VLQEMIKAMVEILQITEILTQLQIFK